MKIKLTVSYDGTNFCGWQVQPNGRSVQAVLQEAVERLTGEKTTVTGSGRTDAGVHAEGQVAHFEVEKSRVPLEKYHLALNPLLPSDVKVLSSSAAADDFNARKSAKQKTYRYTFYKSAVELPLKERYAVRLEKPVDLEKMKQCASVFIGEHDFKCFNASGGCAKTTVRTIYNIDIIEEGDLLSVSVTGNGFLYKMVRTLVGVLLLAGEESATAEDCMQMLKSGIRVKNAKTLSPRGLCLVKVKYE